MTRRNWQIARAKVEREGERIITEGPPDYRTYRVFACEDCGTSVTRRTDGPQTATCTSCSNRRRRKRSVFPCACCGDPVERKPSEIRREEQQIFCSHACQIAVQGAPSKRPEARKKISAAKKGAGNAMYRGGAKRNQPTRSKFSLAVKGEKCCRNCGSSEDLHLHHVIPRSMWKGGRDQILNGVPLCATCHIGWHHRRMTIHRDIFTAQEWEFLSTVELIGQNINAWLDKRYPPKPDSLRDLEHEPTDAERAEYAEQAEAVRLIGISRAHRRLAPTSFATNAREAA